jgi:hypothetical protein
LGQPIFIEGFLASLILTQLHQLLIRSKYSVRKHDIWIASFFTTLPWKLLT